MNESEFIELSGDFFERLTSALDDMDADLDYEEQEGIVTILCKGGSQVIVSRQSGTREIWVAARSGGYHCGHDGTGWVCSRTGESLLTLLNRVCGEQSGQPVAFEL